MRKSVIGLVILMIIIQVLVPANMIWKKYRVIQTGQEVKIRIEPIDPYDAFRGRYVSLWFNYDLDYEERQGKYGILDIDEDGFAFIKEVVTDKPKDGLYLTSEDSDYFSIPLDRYYMEETLAPLAEKEIDNEVEAYITVKIKGDKSVISGLYIDGIPAEEYLKELASL